MWPPKSLICLAHTTVSFYLPALKLILFRFKVYALGTHHLIPFKVDQYASDYHGAMNIYAQYAGLYQVYRGRVDDYGMVITLRGHSYTDLAGVIHPNLNPNSLSSIYSI